MTNVQTKLWEIAEKKLNELGGLSVLMRLPKDKRIPETECIKRCYGYARSGFPNDAECEKELEILQNG